MSSAAAKSPMKKLGRFSQTSIPLRLSLIAAVGFAVSIPLFAFLVAELSSVSASTRLHSKSHAVSMALADAKAEIAQPRRSASKSYRRRH